MYDYLKICNAKRRHADEFIESKTAAEINLLILDLEEYLLGGQDDTHKQLREGYGHIPKPQARKIKEYLYGILEDAWRYSNDKKPGRRRSQLNKAEDSPDINRGFELMLRHRSRRRNQNLKHSA